MKAQPSVVSDSELSWSVSSQFLEDGVMLKNDGLSGRYDWSLYGYAAYCWYIPLTV